MSNGTVMMGHGSGGIMMGRLIDEVFKAEYAQDELKSGDDAAHLDLNKIAKERGVNGGFRVSYSTDSFVVTPHFFPGGDIGRLAVCGTVNDVATAGAIPVAISVAFIIEEGFAIEDLKRICQSIKAAADEAGVEVVTGDTKVVNKGKCDGIYVNTSGVGIIPNGVDVSVHNIKSDMSVILTGSLGDHGITIMSQRENLNFTNNITTDAAPLNHLVQDVLAAAPGTACFRDPTRGGIASTLNEFAEASGVSIEIDETKVPVKPEVAGACEMLGFDVYQVANEGKFVIIVPTDEAEAALSACKKHECGKDAAIIGHTFAPENEQAGARVLVKTALGSRRILDMLVGDLLPRIC